MARKSRKDKVVVPVQVITKPKYNAGAYVRLSAIDRKQKGDSIETQQAIIKAYIAEQNDMCLREIYIDNGLSGQSFERPAFQQMLSDIESGKINCCVVKDLSRLGRNAIDTGYYIERYFPKYDVRFDAINDGFISTNVQSGDITVSLKNMINEAYALEVGRKVRATAQMTKSKGGFISGFAPYGYFKSPDDCHKLVRDEYASSIVQKIYEMAAEGCKVGKIIEWLNGNNILKPSHYFYSLGMGTKKKIGAHTHWSYGAVRSILTNRIYCGDMVQGKNRKFSYVNEKLPESEWVITENTHEGIISREMFFLVQSIQGNAGLAKSKFTTPKQGA